MPDAGPPARGRRARGSAPRRRGTSRRVRLHLTVAALTGLLVLAVAVWVTVKDRDTAPAAGGAVATSTATTPVGDGGSPADPGATSATVSPSTARPSGSGASDSAGSTSDPGPSTGTDAASDSPSSTPHVPTTGAGTFTVLHVPGHDSDRAGRTVHYTVEVEDGLGVDAREFASRVRDILTDRRGWETEDGIHFVKVSPAEAAAGAEVEDHITLASPTTVDRLCAPLQTQGQVSCWNGRRSVINVRRWLLGVPAYAGDLEHYRDYLVNHEVGHALGHQHRGCPGAGKRAPVMLQQTHGLQGCTRWSWPVGA